MLYAIESSCPTMVSYRAHISIRSSMTPLACGVSGMMSLSENSSMTATDQKREDEVLRRMLNTKPKPHKPKPPEEPKDD